MKVALYYRQDNHKVIPWVSKIKRFIKRNFPAIQITNNNPNKVVVLGGDGTIIEAAHKFQKNNAVIMGLNFGHTGFLASVHDKKNFLPALTQFLKGNYRLLLRKMITAEIKRRGKKIFKTNALNEIFVKSPIGIVELEIKIDNHPFQYIRGTGALVATPTGSTALNLAAHGPIITPDLPGMIITELIDYNIPTPSIVVKDNCQISIKVLNFRKLGLLSLSETGEKIDVILIADGGNLFPLEKGDIITIRSLPHYLKFAEFEKHSFFKNLQEKFAFK